MPGLESSPDMLFIIKKKEVCAMPALQCTAVKCMNNKDNHDGDKIIEEAENS